MFGSMFIRIDFEWLNFVKLILDKSDLNAKWFMFRCIYVKSEFYNKFKAKINHRSQKQQILNPYRINFTSKINYPLNPPNKIYSILQPIESILATFKINRLSRMVKNVTLGGECLKFS